MIRQLSQHMRWDPSRPPSRSSSPTSRDPAPRTMSDLFSGPIMQTAAADDTRAGEAVGGSSSNSHGPVQSTGPSVSNNPFDSFAVNNTVFTSHVPFASANSNGNAGANANANANIFGAHQINGQSSSMQEDPFDFSGMGGANAGAGGGGLIDNPFDTFLLHPLGEMTTDDWNRAVASVFGPGQPGGDYNFS